MLQALRDVVDTQVNDWRSDVVFSIFQEQLQAAGLPRKAFLKVLRAYLTGMKVKLHILKQDISSRICRMGHLSLIFSPCWVLKGQERD